MSPICQSFVQNAWRKDLCSNCFKSKEEHCCSGKECDYSSRKEYGTDCKNGLTKRYVGVAGRSAAYSRNYYGKNSWNPIMLDNSNNESRILKSPGLIKGMDSFIKLENEKNRSFYDFNSEMESEKNTPTSAPDDTPLSKNIPTDSWIISKIIGDTREYNNNIKRNLEKKQGDSGSDLGSDTSHDLSGSSGDNSCLGIDMQDAESDSNSVISEPDSAHEDEPTTQSILKIPQHNDKFPKSPRASISFKTEDDVIGYGGDVDYSDDDYSDDDDDDDASISSSDLTPEERVLKHVTEKNTNFNSENENLEKDSILCDNEASNLVNAPVSLTFLRSLSKEESSVEISSLKQEGKVKLKRSPPIGGVKPQIKSNASASFTSSGLDSGYSNDIEDIPMKGIKPKYVSMDEEMKENTSYEEVYEREKVTSIDDLSVSKVTSIDEIAPRITSIDDIFVSKVTSIDDIAPVFTDYIAPRITSVDDIPKKIYSGNASSRITSVDDLLSIPSDEKKVVSSIFAKVDDPLPQSMVDKSPIVKKARNETSNKDALFLDSAKDLDQTNDESVNLPNNSISDVCAVISESKFTLCNSSEQKKLNSLPDLVDNIKETSGNHNSTTPPDFNLSEKRDLDFSVKSAQDNLFIVKHSDNKIFQKNYKNLNAGDKDALKGIENSSRNLEKVRSAVVPLNYINIQRRNSFLESQLAGTVYTGTLDPDLIEGQKISYKDSNVKGVKPSGTNTEKLLEPSQSSIQLTKATKTSKSCSSSSEEDVQQPVVSLMGNKYVTDKYSISLDQKQKGRPTISQDNVIYAAPFSLVQNEAKENSRVEYSMPAIDSKCSRSCENILGSSEEVLNKRCVSSSSLSTFGTLKTPSSAPQSSFLHSGVVRPTIDTNEVNSVIYSTPDFLCDIKNPLKEPPATAGIQKAALYASTSCLKGLPSAKPVTTPKPTTIKEKPRIALKPGISSSRIYQSPTPLTKTISENGYSSTALITPKRPMSMNDNFESTNFHVPTSTSESSVSQTIIENRKPPPTNQAPEIPKNLSESKDNVYDVPVTLGSPTPTSSTVSAPSPTSSSSGYSTTSNISQQEINESDLKQADNPPFSQPNSVANTVIAECSTVSTLTTTSTVTSGKEVSDASHYISAFEAKRNLVSANLCFNKESQVLFSNATDNPKMSNLPTEPELEPAYSLQTVEVIENSIHSHQSSNALSSSNLHTYNMQHSYVNLQPPYENHDVDSYSSFTDDFDDDDDDDLVTNRQFASNAGSDANVLRRTERSSSSTPLFRNSVGPVNYPSIHCSASEFGSSTNVLDGISKLPAVRSHSVPRAVESSVKSNLFGKSKSESSSKFGFVKAAGFFRPSSPPSVTRKLSSERGRDREKKSNSGFSLRKLLRLGSYDKQKSSKEQKCIKDVERESQREARKLQLQIVHPLDYNTNGVEVIARPEARSPAYDIYGSSFQEFLQPQKPDNLTAAQLSKNKEPAVNSLSHSQKLSKAVKKNSFLKKRRKNVEHKDSVKSETRSVITYVRRPSASSNNINTVSTSLNDYAKCINISNVISTTSACESSSVSSLNNQLTTVNLGYNSEGRPRPPPPPRKTSLETANHEVFIVPTNPPPLSSNSSLEALTSVSYHRSEVDTASLSSNSSISRPNRPPPPRRTPSAASSVKGGGCRPVATRDNVYANLGNARASFTPRKPGRSSSVRDEEKEKRRAPNPPRSQNETFSNRLMKGPAPPTPLNSNDHDYEYITDSSPEKAASSNNEINQSTVPSRPEKTTVAGGHSTNASTNMSLEDQYGAVVNANLEALSNMLDQICELTESHPDMKICQNIKHFADVSLISTVPISCGPRLFYSAIYSQEKISVMVTPETKVEVDPLLMPSPILALREELPSYVLNRKLVDKQSKTLSSVWVLPHLAISSLEEFANSLQHLLQEEPLEWEKRICFFLLQMVTALKQLQARGIEEFSLHLFLVINNLEENLNPRLLMSLPSTVGDVANADKSYWSLCHCAAAATQLLLGHTKPLEAATKGPVLAPPFTPSPHAFSTLVSTLREERASSLTKAKCILEAILFGPVNLKLSSEPNRDITIQKWLDLERATVLHSLIREQTCKAGKCPSLLTKFKLFFLIRTSVKALGEALRVLEAPDVTNL